MIDVHGSLAVYVGGTGAGTFGPQWAGLRVDQPDRRHRLFAVQPLPQAGKHRLAPVSLHRSGGLALGAAGDVRLVETAGLIPGLAALDTAGVAGLRC